MKVNRQGYAVSSGAVLVLIAVFNPMFLLICVIVILLTLAFSIHNDYNDTNDIEVLIPFVAIALFFLSLVFFFGFDRLLFIYLLATCIVLFTHAIFFKGDVSEATVV